MPLANGTKFGLYEIVAPLGAGGMGEVYRGRDRRLQRDVAVKVLPAIFTADADRLRRFEQEARTAGALNHPNILVIYDIGTHEAQRTWSANFSKAKRCARRYEVGRFRCAGLSTGREGASLGFFRKRI